MKMKKSEAKKKSQSAGLEEGENIIGVINENRNEN
jgi:hypothetical protein